MRRRDQLAAAADAVRRRPGATSDRAWAFGGASTCRASGRACRTITRRAIKLKCRQFPITVNDVVHSNVREGKGRAAIHAVPHGCADDAASSPAAMFVRTRPELASPDVKCSIVAVQRRPAAGWAAQMVGLLDDRLSASAGKPRRNQAEEPAPGDAPAMIPNYLSTEIDRRAIVAGLQLVPARSGEPGMQHFIESEYLPGPDVQTDDELLDYARRNGGTVFHPTSTCKMGSDPMAVVDPAIARAWDSGLRVVDASIMPTVASGNTNAPTIMIAEKGGGHDPTEGRISGVAPGPGSPWAHLNKLSTRHGFLLIWPCRAWLSAANARS